MARYTEEQWNILTNANAVDVALSLGLKIDEKGSDRNAYHIEGYGGLFIWKSGSGFYHVSENAKGNAPQLVQHILKCSYRDALDYINDNLMHGNCTPSETSSATYQKKPIVNKSEVFAVPKREPKAARVYAYLIKTRRIDPDIVRLMVEKGAIVQEAAHGNVCFIGFDKSGTPRYCALRGTVTDIPFKGEVEGSDKNFGFCIPGQSRRLIIFESAIDALSYATLEKFGNKTAWQKDTKLSLGGCVIKALEQHLNDYPESYDEIRVAVDNDEAGHKFTAVVEKEYGDKYLITRHCPAAKDFNEDLKNICSMCETDKGLSHRTASVRYYARQEMTEEAPQESEDFEMET